MNHCSVQNVDTRCMEKMMSDTLLNITPTINELTSPDRIKCIVADCSSTFQNNSTLQFHLRKHHKLHVTQAIDRNAKVRYFCPATNCKYNLSEANKNALSFFASKKYLRQHFLKVHAAKEFNCDKCDKKFASPTLRHQHAKMCGIIFRCDICGWTYNSRECLLTHCRRKGHEFPNALKCLNSAKHADTVNTVGNKCMQSRASGNLKYIRIEPKNFKHESLLPVTQPADKIIKKQSKISQMTQTASLYKVNCSKMSAVIGNPTSTTKIVRAIKSNDGGTQTDQKHQQEQQDIPQQPSKPSDKYKDLELIDEESSTMISNASQTYRNLNHLNCLEDESTLAYFDNELNAGLCHIETQTPFPSSNMHTQTCDEILSELGFATIETQTNWPRDDYNDLFVSTQTQTCFPQQILLDNNISTQTQTSTDGWKDNQCTQAQQTDYWQGS